jgi:hypothetical protein
MHASRTPLLLTAVIVVCTSCNTDGLCTAIDRTSLIVTVVDAQSGARIDSGSTVVVTGEGLHDSISVPDSSRFAPTAVWHESEIPAGTYSVAVRKPGYTDWTRDGVVIKRDGCHVTFPANLTAALQRLGQ